LASAPRSRQADHKHEHQVLHNLHQASRPSHPVPSAMPRRTGRRCVRHRWSELIPDRSLPPPRSEHGFFASALYNGFSDVLPALAASEREKTWLGAIVRSHSRTSAIPSRSAFVAAMFPGVLSAIVGFSPTINFRAWSLDYDEHGVAVRFDEVPVNCQNTGERSQLGFMKRSRHNRDTLRAPVKGSA
jgi:hypothetical protein